MKVFHPHHSQVWMKVGSLPQKKEEKSIQGLRELKENHLYL
jgi:hypothetical protein